MLPVFGARAYATSVFQLPRQLLTSSNPLPDAPRLSLRPPWRVPAARTFSRTRLSAAKVQPQYRPDPFEPPSLNQEELEFLMKEERDAERARGLDDDDGDYGTEEVDELQEWRKFEADVKAASAGLRGVEFGKQLSKDELDEAFLKKFRNTAEMDDDVFPPGFFDYQDKVASRKGPPQERLATDPVRQAERKMRKEAEVEVDEEGDARIHGCKIPSKYVGYFTDPHNYRMEKTLRYEEKLRKQIERAEKRRLTSTWKYDPDQLVAADRENSPASAANDITAEARTRRQLRVSSKLRDALDNTLEDFLRKYAPKLYLRGTDFQILDVSIAKDMKTAKILYSANESREYAAGVFRKHSATIRFELTKAIQPQKWSPELKFVHIDDEITEKPDSIRKRTGALQKMLEQEIRKLSDANPDIWKQAEELERTQKAAEEARKRRTALIDGTGPTSALDSLGLASAMRGAKSTSTPGTAALKAGNHRTKRLHRREKIEL